MNDNEPIEVIRSHHDDNFSLHSHQNDHEPPRTHIEPPVDADEKYNRDVPPDGGYGWVCVACVFWINAHTWGINSSYGVFLSHYLSHNVFPNTSSLFYAFTGGLSISCALLVAPLATYLIHVLGTRFVLNLGVFFETLSLIGSSFATQKWHIMLSQGVCFGWGMGFLFVASVGIAPQWFHKRRSVAQGITAAGSGLGGLIYSLAVGAIIPRFGLGWAFRILGIIACVVNLVCGNLLRDRNKLVGSRLTAFHFPLVRRPEFLLFLGWGIFSMLGYVALLFSVANFALSIGLTSHQGSIVSALLNLGQGLGRPFVGMFSDRLGRINIATILTFLCGFLCLYGCSLLLCRSGWNSRRHFLGHRLPVLAEIIGLRDLPSGLSITWLTLVGPCTVSEAIALQLRSNKSDGGTNYLKVQLFTGFMYIGASLCIWLVRGWKVGELERAQQRRESIAREAPLKDGDKQEHPMTVASSARSTDLTSDVQIWAPVGLIRRMVAPKRV
ncbi:hypothetical protein N7450_003128 [Penicillium hetheringtonii]|uniref:Major facilitator superfamily (MFS) profile domain-containing protein n=1 Tax=Penicillium hetheringtonii TaxID=911720 RepID=A0AAD6DX77_9EURO|nr:hypothetical protein N7450_003128 [Penicillium hetheringtonii]